MWVKTLATKKSDKQRAAATETAIIELKDRANCLCWRTGKIPSGDLHVWSSMAIPLKTSTCSARCAALELRRREKQ